MISHIDPWLSSRLACPYDRLALREVGETLVCDDDHAFPVVDGVPVVLRADVPQTHDAIGKTLDDVHENRVSRHRIEVSGETIDPVVQAVVGATCGNLYKSLIGKLTRYPIPHLRLPPGEGRALLDIGCNWGRWTVAAARKGYRGIGIDPDLGAVLAAKRIAGQVGVNANFVVGDARYLPFLSHSFDTVFSYSVIQHFSKSDARLAFGEVSRVLKAGGLSMIQMPNAYGIRSTYHRVRRRPASDFAVRYWKPAEIKKACEEDIGPTELSVDGFFGLGIQAADMDILPRRYKLVVRASEGLRKLTDTMPFLRSVADSLYATSTAGGGHAHQG